MLAPVEQVTQGTLRTTTGQSLPLDHTDVTARIRGPVAEVELRQTFRNDTGGPIEAVYLFPLPHEASVYRMQFRIGDRVVKASIKEKEEAKRAYEKARSEGRAATLLEQDRPNLFTLSVANIAPGATIEVELAYQELVEFDDGQWRFVFPMVASERHHGGTPIAETKTEAGPATSQVPDAARIRPPRAATGKRAPDVSLCIELRPELRIDPPSSPSHTVSVSETSGGAYRIELSPSDALPNRDFVIAWRSREDGVRPRVWFERAEGKPGTFLLVVTPPVRELDELPRFGPEGLPIQCGNCGAPLQDPRALHDVAGIGEAWECKYCGAVIAAVRPADKPQPQPRDVVLLIDRSASMRSASLQQARVVTRTLVEHLAFGDAVHAIAFDHDRIHAGDDPAGWIAVGPDTRAHADAFLDSFLAGLTPRGGTELEEALECAARIPARSGRTRILVLLTDGAVGNEGRLQRRVRELLGSSRLFVLGLGPAVNRFLVARLARAGGGASDVIVPGEDPSVVTARFARRVRHGGPVLGDLRLAWDDAMPADVYPSPIPDLFGGQPVRLLGRFVGEGPTRLALSGTTPAGLPFRQQIDVTLPVRSEQVPGLERLWARHRIESRLERLAQEPGEQGDIRLEVIGLALKHSLMSPYTSLVAEDSERSVDGPAKRVEVELQEPAQSFESLEAGQATEDAAPCAPAGAPVGIPRSMPRAAMPPPPAPCPPARAHACPAPPPAIAAFGASAAFVPMKPGGIFGGVVDAVRDALGGKSQQRHKAPVRHADTEDYAADVLAKVRTRAIGELDLVFLVDETGSMGEYIEEVKERLLELVEALRAAPLCRSLRVGLVTYRDHPPQDSTFVSRVVPLTDDIAAVQRGVESMAAAGGGDGPEAVTDGLYDVVRLSWRERAARVVVWVGDAPPHGVEPTNDGFPQGCPCGHHWYAQAESCREMGIVIHAVGCLPLLQYYVGAEEVFRTVARTTRGLYLPLKRAKLLIPLVAGVAETELDKQRIEEEIAEIVAAWQEPLRQAEEGERIRFIAEMLRANNVRPRSMHWNPQAPSEASLRFREVTEDDVEEGLDRLRRGRRVEV
ncbi:MAG TPA: VIT domain-containing protein [Polyangiaceae bacterium]|nr:VIT domain-containing protein [Polyangiaceae bacterium]